jgi:hypothetical protein
LFTAPCCHFLDALIALEEVIKEEEAEAEAGQQTTVQGWLEEQLLHRRQQPAMILHLLLLPSTGSSLTSH